MRPATTLKMLLNQIAPGAKLPPGAAALTLGGISNDSREVKAGDLFLACRGEQHDGHRFIEDAIAKGAVAVVAEQEQVPHPRVPVIVLPELARVQGRLAAQFYGQPSRQLQMVGITGTNGKTSCSYFIAQVLSEMGIDTALIGTTGNGFVGSLTPATHTTPDAVKLQQLLAELQQQGAKAVAMEVSSHALEQGRVAEVEFEQALFTNLSRDHLDYHGSMQAYADAKAQLFVNSTIRRAVINTDDPFGRELLQRLPKAVEVLAIGEQPVQGVKQLQVESVELHAQGIRAQLSSPWGALRVDSPLLGRFNLDNLLGALGVLVGFDIEPQRALASLNQVAGVEGRMQAFGEAEQPRVVVDYAHTPDALEKALASLRQHCQGRLWCLFGCGGDRDRGKRALMARAAEALADQVVVTSDNPRSEAPDAILDEIMTGFDKPEQVIRQSDRRQAIEQLLNRAVAGDMVLIAGKGHENYQEINGVRYPFSDIDEVKRLLGGEGC